MSRPDQHVPPPELWERPDMARALAERDMGTVIRIFRQWTGASQADVGGLVGWPQPHISGLENGTRRVSSLELFERFADGLRIPRALLGLAEGAHSDVGLARSSTGTGVNYRSGETDETVLASHRDWLATRRRLNVHRSQLTHAVSKLYPASDQLASTGILMPEAWRLPAPVDLASVELRWQGDAPAPAVTGQHAETRPLRPLMSPGQRYTRYHRAMRDLDRPRLFENRLCYRLLGVHPGEIGDTHVALDLKLGNMCYFDMIDVGEALAHEAALAVTDSQGHIREELLSWERLPFRRMLRNPFALAAYPLMLSVSTLTIRQSPAGATFFLLRRHPAKVAIAGGMLSVFPTGVFQPASVVPAPRSPDFDLWRNVMREYSEEYLGNPEHDGDGPPIDYDNEEPFRTLDAARRAGKIRVFCLGIGIDALNYVGDVFTAAVFDADVFDDVFDHMIEQNEEGSLELGEDRQAFTFNGDTIEHLLSTEPLAPSGAACLHLAWQHRDSIARN